LITEHQSDEILLDFNPPVAQTNMEVNEVVEEKDKTMGSYDSTRGKRQGGLNRKNGKDLSK
jgi:hypothetical protein